MQHDTGNHPESIARLRSVYARLKESGLDQRFERGVIKTASRAQVERIHSPNYLDTLAQFASQGGGRIEKDTVVSLESFDVALKAAGSAISAVDDVLSGTHSQAVCLTRPPGHHALMSAAMGFCLFNNAAVAAKHAEEAHGLSRILIIDWDVHHGNGTQAIFFDSPNEYFFSAHRSPFYPGTGARYETGRGDGLGTIFNLPLPFGIERKEYRESFHTVLEQAVVKCQPELIIISAGFDAHHLDPVGSLGLQSEDFIELTQLVMDAAGQYCNGKIVSLLEGGYNVKALAESVECHLETLLAGETHESS